MASEGQLRRRRSWWRITRAETWPAGRASIRSTSTGWSSSGSLTRPGDDAFSHAVTCAGPAGCTASRWPACRSKEWPPPSGRARFRSPTWMRAAFDQFAEVSGTTFHELSERTGIPMDLLKVGPRGHRLCRAAARGPTSARTNWRSCRRSSSSSSKGFRPVVIERWLRVCADSLRRIAETETDWWRTEVELPLLEARHVGAPRCSRPKPTSGPEMTPRAWSRWFSPSTTASRSTRAWSNSALQDVEEALERAGLLRPTASSAGSVLPGYHWVHAADRGAGRRGSLQPWAEKLAALVRRDSQEHGGRPVKWLGDGVMFSFRGSRPERPRRPRHGGWRGDPGASARPRGCSTPGRRSSRRVTTSAEP